MSIVQYLANFNGTELSSAVPGLSVIGTNPYKAPRRRAESLNIARTNKGKVTSGFYVEKQITVRVSISRESRDKVEQSLDILMGLLQGLEKDLILNVAGLERRYTATYSDYDYLNNGGSYLEIDLVFVCSDRFGYEIPATNLVNVTGQTGSTRTDSIGLSGSAPTQAPIAQVTITALTGGTNATVALLNNNTGQGISVTRTWLANDVLVIDSNERTVKVNGVEVAFTGAFPEFTRGAGSISLTNNFTTRTYDYLVYYYKRYV